MFSDGAPSPKLLACGQAAGLWVSQELLGPRDWEVRGRGWALHLGPGWLQAAGAASVGRNSVLRCWHDGPLGTSLCTREGNGAVGRDPGV